MGNRLWAGTAVWEDQTFGVIVGESGIREIVLPHQWEGPGHPGRALPGDDARLRPYLVELDEYWAGRRHAWTLPLDLRGTPFQLAVWGALQEIPYGKTCTYREVAECVGRPRAVRAAAAAVARNPVPVVVPCHRVVGADGTLTGYQGGLALKKRLLALEGVHGIRDAGHQRYQF
ncbi:MAG: methylated-DNA--[protein]-cysteine S-methyltransferase [Firmicutes bacterium]|nr:methylated-DNA--[protein]-cysteine S-methyltransferase [Bacillota bacterium]